MLDKLTKWISDSFTQWLTHDEPYEGIPLCDFERIRYELRPCDVLLIEGRSRVSEIIRTITQSSWSHAALYIGRLHDIQDPKTRNLISAHFKGPPDTQLLIEGIMGKGGLVSDLMSYQKDHIRLCRPRGLSRQDAQQVIAYAVRKLGHDYDVRHVIDLARFLLPWTLFPRRFRSKLFEYHPGDSTKTVCSTLIAEAFNHVEFPILPLVKHHATKKLELITRNPRLYSPRDFDYSPYFEIIKYPFVEFADYAMYRQLPWNREGLISHDRMGVREGLTFETHKNKEKPKTKDGDDIRDEENKKEKKDKKDNGDTKDSDNTKNTRSIKDTGDTGDTKDARNITKSLEVEEQNKTKERQKILEPKKLNESTVKDIIEEKSATALNMIKKNPLTKKFFNNREAKAIVENKSSLETKQEFKTDESQANKTENKPSEETENLHKDPQKNLRENNPSIKEAELPRLPTNPSMPQS